MPEIISSRMRVEDVDAYSQYLLHSPSEITFVLREAAQKGCMITVYFDAGQSFFLTSVLDVSPQGVVLDYGSDETVNQRALRADRLICLTSINRVKVQFALHGIAMAQYDGRPAFSSHLPENLLRLQRREFFRVSTPIANPVKCDIPITHDTESGSGTLLQIPLIDISVGGMGLMATLEQRGFFAPGRALEGCVLSLPGEAQIVMKLEIRDAFEITTRSGGRHIRVGCEYCDLRVSALNIIQRYISRLERERKARISGME
ncbi:MAG: flagellar brake protein [Zoogloeaceae bacterium]|jgi:c-di-GMP-binding flagellar brake protein YcgR|nr:flagellar brake protein [Zoogloeaceae bacterium]